MDRGADTNTRWIRPARYSAPVMAMLVMVLPVPSYISMSNAQELRLMEGGASPPSDSPSRPQAKR